MKPIIESVSVDYTDDGDRLRRDIASESTWGKHYLLSKDFCMEPDDRIVGAVLYFHGQMRLTVAGWFCRNTIRFENWTPPQRQSIQEGSIRVTPLTEQQKAEIDEYCNRMREKAGATR